MIKIYLLLNSLSYLIFSFWCIFKPEGTAKFLGYSFLNNSGRVEYAAVYAGLEIGMAAFFAICGFLPEMKLSGLIFAVCLYAGLIISRTSAAFYYGDVTTATYVVGGLEYALGIWGIILLVNEFR